MVLLVAPSRRALPRVTVPVPCRKLVLRSRHGAAEAQLRRELAGGQIDLVLSVGFAAAVDRRLSPGDLLVATRVFGGADLYLDLPPFQAPGAVRGSLCTLLEGKPPAPLRGRNRLPPVYAFDDHAFWLARAARAAHVDCLVLRSILIEPPAEGQQLDPLLDRLLAGRFISMLRQRPERWRELPDLLRGVDRCRFQLTSALAILLVLYGQR
jgi:hypothetical protein